ncbi:MAG: DUF3313 family protein [Pseudomonadota bacterium]
MAADAVPNDQGMIEVKNTGFDFVYVKSDLDLSLYTSIFVDDVALAYTQRADEYQLTDIEKTKLKAEFARVFPEELAKTSGLDISSSVDPGTLRLWIAVTGLSINASEDYDRLLRRDLFVQTPGSMTITGIISDAQTAEPLLVFKDGKRPNTMVPEKLTKASARSDFRRVMRKWAATVSNGLAQARTYGLPDVRE